MIYLLSDIHGDINFSGLKKYLETADETDLLIILGDVGLMFGDSEENRIFTNTFLMANKKIAFIDGNHENFGYINSFPEEQQMGGTVNRLTENIVHLKRGNIYEIDGKTLFVFGGCKSSPKWKEQGLWYPGEEPNDEEMNLAYSNLREHNNKVDFVLTHKYENGKLGVNISMPLLELCKYIDDNVSFEQWYSGHWHRGGEIDEKHLLVYDELIPIE